VLRPGRSLCSWNDIVKTLARRPHGPVLPEGKKGWRLLISCARATRTRYSIRSCSKRAVLVGRAQWEINQPPPLKRYRASLEGASQGGAPSTGALRPSRAPFSRVKDASRIAKSEGGVRLG
jgi:hypothetical protein